MKNTLFNRKFYFSQHKFLYEWKPELNTFSKSYFLNVSGFVALEIMKIVFVCKMAGCFNAMQNVMYTFLFMYETYCFIR